MLKEEKLDVFLDAFLDGKKPAQETDLDFWDEKSEPEKNDFWEAQDVLTAPKHKGKLSKRTIASMFLILILIPVTIWIGITLFDDRKYFVISLAIAVYCMLPFFLIFEGRKPQARELLTIAVLVAIAVAGRAAFFMVPSFKPVVAVTIISAVCFGAESGFLVGALSMLSSNMLFGQGPWTPWQMFAFGMIGFLAGILYQKGILKARKADLCIFGFLSVFLIYGGIMNPASALMAYGTITWQSLLAFYISGAPVDLVHALSTVIFLWFLSRPLLEKLERIKKKYGLIESQKEEII